MRRFIAVLVLLCISMGRAPSDLTPRAWLPIVARPAMPFPVCPSGVTVLPNHNYYISYNYLHIVGEVCNNTANTLKYVEITANLKNGSGNLVGTDFTYAMMDHLPPHTRTCFDVTFLTIPTGWTTYSFEPVSSSVSSVARPNLTVLNSQGTYNQSTHYFETIGMIRNDAATTIRYVMPVITLYNATAKVIGCDFTFVNTADADLTAGQSSSFDNYSIGRDYSDVAGYVVQVDGTP